MGNDEVKPSTSRSKLLFFGGTLLLSLALATFFQESKFLKLQFTSSGTTQWMRGGSSGTEGEIIRNSPESPVLNTSDARSISPSPGIEETTGEEGGEKIGTTKESLKVAMLTVSADVDIGDDRRGGQYGKTKSIVTGPISIDNKVRYCVEHGWDLVIGGPLEGGNVGTVMEGRSSRWLKIYYLLKIFDDYDVIVWMDLDTLMTTPEVNIVEYFDQEKDLHLTDDWGPWDRINSGVFALKTTEWSRTFFEAVWKHNDSGEGQSDQKSLNHVLKQLAKKEKTSKVDVIDRTIYNAFPKILNVYIEVGMLLPDVVRNNDGDATENTLVIHFAGAFSGCCNANHEIPNGMLVQYFVLLFNYHRGFLSRITDDSMALDPPPTRISGYGSPASIRTAADVMERLDKMIEEINAVVAGGKEMLKNETVTSALRENIVENIYGLVS